MELTTYNSLYNYFDITFSDLKCHSNTRAYIISIYEKYKTSEFDLSNQSITILFEQARQNHRFEIYQNLGDWIFFSNTINPQSLHHATKEYYDTVARLSYYSCYRIINKKWQLFEQLADEFIDLTNQINRLLHTNNLPHIINI